MRDFKHTAWALCRLMRWHKPIGTSLLLWPTLWALWLATAGQPAGSLVLIFGLGCFVMRSAGCVINDICDRQFDRHVQRTADRPLAQGQVSLIAAYGLFVALCGVALLLVLFLNDLAFQLSWVGLLLAMLYPLSKRITHLPQLVLGLTFNWGIVMAYAAACNTITQTSWIVYAIAVVWTVAYDTQYAMVDRVDDLKIGIKSTAILFGSWDIAVVMALYLVMFIGLIGLGAVLQFPPVYYAGVGLASLSVGYQCRLMRQRQPAAYFAAFRQNNFVGMAIFLGLFFSYYQ